MSNVSFSKLYSVGSIGAIRCEKVASAILSDIKYEPVAYSAPRSFKSYLMYNDSNGWLDVTVYAKKHKSDDRLITVMRRDNKRKKCTVLDVRICTDGRHLLRTHTWSIEV